MNFSSIRRRLKPWMLPIAMFMGILLHNYIGYVAFLSKYIIFVMLLITYCRLKLSDFHIGGYIGWLLVAQVGGAVAVYLLLRPLNELVAQGAFICIFCPTATAAPVITGMLGGSVPRVATYSLFSNLAVALLGPFLLSWMASADVMAGYFTATVAADAALVAPVSFGESFRHIAATVSPVILGPLAIALLMERFAPKAHDALAHHQGLSFYIWAFALIIVVGNSVSFMLREPTSMIPTILVLAIVSAVTCVAQFAVGRAIGARYNDRVSGAQSLGQKNTVLAIWLALSYLNPVVSIAPAAYVAWHNTVNSYQIYLHERHSGKGA